MWVGSFDFRILKTAWWGRKKGEAYTCGKGGTFCGGSFNRELQKLELHFRALRSSHEAKYGEARYKM